MTAAPAAVMTTSPSTRTTAPSSRRSGARGSAGDRTEVEGTGAGVVGDDVGERELEALVAKSSTSTAPKTASVAASTEEMVAGPLDVAGQQEGDLDSTRGWMNRSSRTGSPYAESMPLVTRP